MGFAVTLAARLVRGTTWIDRVYRRFDRERSKSVMKWAPDAFFDEYNDVTFGRQTAYHANSNTFRAQLFPFEQRAFDTHFPAPPATILIGGAGGGREAFALGRLGYRVVSFEPARALVSSMPPRSPEMAIDAFVGRYEDLPFVSALDGARVDLREQAPFDAAVLGWGSFSHLRSDTQRREAFTQYATLTDGPILVSYFPIGSDTSGADRSGGTFSAHVGFHRGSNAKEICALARASGLEVILADDDDNWPHAILRRVETGSPKNR